MIRMVKIVCKRNSHQAHCITRLLCYVLFLYFFPRDNWRPGHSFETLNVLYQSWLRDFQHCDSSNQITQEVASYEKNHKFVQSLFRLAFDMITTGNIPLTVSYRRLVLRRYKTNCYLFFALDWSAWGFCLRHDAICAFVILLTPQKQLL